MRIIGHFPPKCELDAITEAVIAACDPLNGVTDGLISDPDACSFDPFSVVDEAINCTTTGEVVTISDASAQIVNMTWSGPRKANGESLWYGVDYQARLTSSGGAVVTAADLGYASTNCSSNGTCVGVPIGLAEPWVQLFVEKNSEWNYTMVDSVEEFARLFHASVQQYDSIIGTSDADLSSFQQAGGKLITYHGLADGIIPVRGTKDYYDRAIGRNPNVKDFFRYFEVPGLAHCSGGVGGQPTATFKALVDWVEKGIVPETLPIAFNDTNGTQYERILCPYPERARLISDSLDVTKPESYRCSASKIGSGGQRQSLLGL